MRSIDDITLLGDQILVRRIFKDETNSSFWTPDAEQVHRSGDDYLHRGLVLKCGPGDTCLVLRCARCNVETYRIPQNARDASGGQRITPKCFECGGALYQVVREDGFEFLAEPMPPGSSCATISAAMQTKPGDIVLFEQRRDAKLQPRRFPSLDLSDDSLVILHEEQNVLAIMEAA